MHKSIFDIEIRLNINKEFHKMVDYFHSINGTTYCNGWGYIVNKFGINHKIEEKYKNISNEERLEWYDKAFYLAIHLIRLEKIKDINQERKDLEK